MCGHIQLQNSECFSIQFGWSVDKYGVDNKFITVRFISENDKMKSVFLRGISKSSLRRGQKSFYAISQDCPGKVRHLVLQLNISWQDDNIYYWWREWKYILENAVVYYIWIRKKAYDRGKALLRCIWWVAHRSDLAMSELESAVIKVQQWKINLSPRNVLKGINFTTWGTWKAGWVNEANYLPQYRLSAHFDHKVRGTPQ